MWIMLSTEIRESPHLKLRLQLGMALCPCVKLVGFFLLGVANSSGKKKEKKREKKRKKTWNPDCKSTFFYYFTLIKNKLRGSLAMQEFHPFGCKKRFCLI